ncbi:hypothetical protein FB451DRAFT_1391210 [Mycena latifolia]|nr:hypothetical protein FB451DRAFT_1391210 [Mycena latifolia]
MFQVQRAKPSLLVVLLEFRFYGPPPAADASEERFWRALVLRVRRAYGVSLLTTASLLTEIVATGTAEEDDGAPEDRMHHFGFPGPQPSSRLPRRHHALPHAVPSPARGRFGERRDHVRGDEAAVRYTLYFTGHARAPGDGNAVHQLAILARCVSGFAAYVLLFSS